MIENDLRKDSRNEKGSTQIDMDGMKHIMGDGSVS